MKKIILIVMALFMTTIQAYAYVTGIHLTVAPKAIEFHLENPNGLITGYTPSGIQEAIPEITLYDEWSIPSYDPSTDPYDYFHMIEATHISQQLMGKYKIVLYGTTIPITGNIYLSFMWSENSAWHAQYSGQHLIYPNASWTYEFDFPVTVPANGQIVLTKVAQPTDLIKDITTAGQLGYIGNTKFVSELTKEINEIEAERSKVDPSHSSGDDGLTPAQKAKKEYTELLKEITEKYNKPESDEFVKQEAYTVLKEDLEYIIGHL